MAYPNPATQDRDAFTAVQLGFRVDRAAAALPQTAQTAAFTVTGGRVAIFILGEVVTVLGATATNLKIVSNPTTGTDVDLCAVLAVASKEAGTLFGITGIFSDALVGANAGATVLAQRPVIVPTGTIDISTSGSDTGTVKWTLWYKPIDTGATVTAA